MHRDTKTVWLRGACILSVMLIGTSMGGLWQTASAADSPDESSGQTADVTGVIEAPLAVEPAVAATLGTVYHTRGQNNYTFAQGTNNLVPLDGTGLLRSKAFNTTGKFLVTYTAECTVGAAVGNQVTWLNIDIEVVNIATGAITVLPPSNGTADALCTSPGTGSATGWRMSSITGIATGMPLADYAVQIRANILNGVAGNSGWLGDTTLVIRK